MPVKDLLSLMFIGSLLLAPYIANFIFNNKVPDPIIVHVNNKKKKSKPKQIKTIYTPPSKIIQKIPVEQNPIKMDAIECLIALGMKRTNAKIKIDNMFNKTQYETIEDFLMDVYKK